MGKRRHQHTLWKIFRITPRCKKCYANCLGLSRSGWTQLRAGSIASNTHTFVTSAWKKSLSAAAATASFTTLFGGMWSPITSPLRLPAKVGGNTPFCRIQGQQCTHQRLPDLDVLCNRPRPDWHDREHDCRVASHSILKVRHLIAFEF